MFFSVPCVDLVSLNVCQHCSCTSVHILCTPANVVTSALAQVFSKTVIHGVESRHSLNSLFCLTFSSVGVSTHTRRSPDVSECCFTVVHFDCTNVGLFCFAEPPLVAKSPLASSSVLKVVL